MWLCLFSYLFQMENIWTHFSLSSKAADPHKATLQKPVCRFRCLMSKPGSQDSGKEKDPKEEPLRGTRFEREPIIVKWDLNDYSMQSYRAKPNSTACIERIQSVH